MYVTPGAQKLCSVNPQLPFLQFTRNSLPWSLAYHLLGDEVLRILNIVPVLSSWVASDRKIDHTDKNFIARRGLCYVRTSSFSFNFNLHCIEFYTQAYSGLSVNWIIITLLTLKDADLAESWPNKQQSNANWGCRGQSQSQTWSDQSIRLNMTPQIGSLGEADMSPVLRACLQSHFLQSRNERGSKQSWFVYSAFHRTVKYRLFYKNRIHVRYFYATNFFQTAERVTVNSVTTVPIGFDEF